MRPYYDHAGITIFLGDCREILPGLGAFDLLLTDPPYGIGLDTRNVAKKRDNVIPARKGIGGRGVLRNHDYPPVAGDEGPFDPSHLLPVAPAHVLWGANHYASKLPANPMWLVWDRVTGSCDTTDAELAWVNGHRFKTVRLFKHQWCGILRDSEKADRYVHPTQKPVALMRWCLGFFPEAQSVIDPYMGSGPVARACKDAGKRYVGIEIEERYCEIAAKRLAQEVLFA